MTVDNAIHAFFSSFTIPAYAATSVPDNATYPYLTYELVVGDWSEKQSIPVQLWYLTDSEAVPNAKAKEIADAIGYGGIILAHDDGGIWLTRGSPWCQSLNDENTKMVKRRYILVDVELI